MQQTKSQRVPSHPIYMNEGLSPKKTALIIVTVIGCIAILWPKVFYPMMFGSGVATPKGGTKEQRGPGGCCDVVLDREKFLNDTPSEIGPQLYRKRLNLYTGELSLRQERPAHLHPESIYQAMRERGRAITPATPSVPIVDRKGSPSNPPPRIVEGRPGPIPGMRPPMGAGSLQQPQAKGSSMGFIMPLYTIGIIVFFGYTIMKIVFKKPIPNPPYGPAPNDPNFRREVFGQENGRHIEDLNGSKFVVTAIQGLIDAADEQLKLRENNATSDLSKQSNETSTSNHGDISNGHTNTEHAHEDITNISAESSETVVDSHDKEEIQNCKEEKTDDKDTSEQRKKREGSVERSVAPFESAWICPKICKVLGMEMTASCEGGKKWSKRPPTPVFFLYNEHSKSEDDDDMPEPQSIYLEGALAHDSQILVADSETKTEEVYNEELNGSIEEPAVVLSSKMTLSLINLDSSQENGDGIEKTTKTEIDSPLADDIEIIGHDEN